MPSRRSRSPREYRSRSWRASESLTGVKTEMSELLHDPLRHGEVPVDAVVELGEAAVAPVVHEDVRAPVLRRHLLHVELAVHAVLLDHLALVVDAARDFRLELRGIRLRGGLRHLRRWR